MKAYPPLSREQQRRVEENLHLAERAAAEYGRKGMDREEARSLAQMGLIEAAAEFVEERGRDFADFAGMHMQRAIVDQYRGERSLERRARVLRAIVGFLIAAAMPRGGEPSGEDVEQLPGGAGGAGSLPLDGMYMKAIFTRSGGRDALDVKELRAKYQLAIRTVRGALPKLHVKQREALTQLYSSNLSYDDAAGAMGITVGKLRTLEEHALATLQEALKRAGIEELPVDPTDPFGVPSVDPETISGPRSSKRGAEFARASSDRERSRAALPAASGTHRVAKR